MRAAPRAGLLQDLHARVPGGGRHGPAGVQPGTRHFAARASPRRPGWRPSLPPAATAAAAASLWLRRLDEADHIIYIHPEAPGGPGPHKNKTLQVRRNLLPVLTATQGRSAQPKRTRMLGDGSRSGESLSVDDGSISVGVWVEGMANTSSFRTAERGWESACVRNTTCPQRHTEIESRSRKPPPKAARLDPQTLVQYVCPLVDKNVTDFDAQVVVATNKQTRTTDRPGMGRAEPRLQASKPTEGLTQRDTCSERSKTYPYPRGLTEPEIFNFGRCERPPSTH